MKKACSVTPSWKKYLHHHFSLKSQNAPLKQKIIARLKKKGSASFYTTKLSSKSQNGRLKQKIIARLKKLVRLAK